MADLEAAVRDLVARDRDCTMQALAQLELRRRIKLLIGEWRAAGGGDVLPDVRGRWRLRPDMRSGPAVRPIALR